MCVCLCVRHHSNFSTEDPFKSLPILHRPTFFEIKKTTLYISYSSSEAKDPLLSFPETCQHDESGEPIEWNVEKRWQWKAMRCITSGASLPVHHLQSDLKGSSVEKWWRTNTHKQSISTYRLGPSVGWVVWKKWRKFGRNPFEKMDQFLQDKNFCRFMSFQQACKARRCDSYLQIWDYESLTDLTL